MDGWITEMCYVHTTEYLVTWVELEIAVPNEVTRAQKDKCHVFSHTWMLDF